MARSKDEPNEFYFEWIVCRSFFCDRIVCEAFRRAHAFIALTDCRQARQQDTQQLTTTMM